jgi:hypothetical protein
MAAAAAVHTHSILAESEQVPAETVMEIARAAHTLTEYRGTDTCDGALASEPTIPERHSPVTARRAGRETELQRREPALPGPS